MKFSIGGPEYERIEVNVLGYEREPAGEYYDDNWLQCLVSMQTGGFSGKFSVAFMTEDFSRFLDELSQLYDKLIGKAEFKTIEEQLYILAEGDGKGHIKVHGEAMDEAGIGNRLVFNLDIDQTQLAKTIKELENVVSSFPVRAP